MVTFLTIHRTIIQLVLAIHNFVPSGTKRASKYDAKYEINGHENIYNIKYECILQQFNKTAQLISL